MSWFIMYWKLWNFPYQLNEIQSEDLIRNHSCQTLPTGFPLFPVRYQQETTIKSHEGKSLISYIAEGKALVPSHWICSFCSCGDLRRQITHSDFNIRIRSPRTLIFSNEVPGLDNCNLNQIFLFLEVVCHVNIRSILVV